MSEVMEFSDNFILNDNAGLSVGFKSEDSIKPLKIMLENLFSRQIYQNKVWAEKNQELLKKQIQESNEIGNSINNLLTTNNKNNKTYNDTLNTRLVSLTDELKNGNKTRDAYLKTILNVAVKVLDSYMDNATRLASIFRGIESGGVFVKDGFNSLGQTAYKLGMTYDELADNLKKTAPLISKLNSSFGNGVKVFENSLSNISKAYNLTHDEQVAAFEAAMESLTPSQLRNMSEQQLIAQVDETARQMKLLSLATGKSVENLKEENSIKERAIRIRAYGKTHQNELRLMRAMGFDDEMIDYFLSGGTKVSSKILMQMANDPLRQTVYPEIMRLLQTGQFNEATIAKLQSQYGHLAKYKNDLAIRASSNPAMYGPAAFSELWEYSTMDTSFGDNFLNLNLNDAMNAYNSPERASSNAMLRNATNYKEAINRHKVGQESLKSGGTEGMSKAFTVASIPYSVSGFITQGTNNLLNKFGLSGLTSGLLATLAGSAVPAVGSYIGGRIGIGFGGDVRRFSLAVDKFSKSVGRHGKSDTIIDELFNRTIGKTKIGRKMNILARRPSMLFKGMSLARGLTGFGIGAIGNGISYAIDYDTTKKLQSGELKKTDDEYKLRTYGSSMLSYGSTGLGLGMMFGPVGAAVGAIGGALIGAGVEWYKQYQEGKMSEQSTLKPNGYSTISSRAVVNNMPINYAYDENMKKMIENQVETNNILRYNNTLTENAVRDNKLIGKQIPIIYSNAQEK